MPVACKPVVDIGELGGLKVFTFDTFDQLGISLQYLLHSVQRIVYRSDLLRIEISDNERQSEEHAGYRYREQVQCTSYRDQYPDGRESKELYGEEFIQERHRHRYEFNNDYREQFEQNNVVFSGVNDQYNLVEMLEIPQNKFFLGCQFHPEFKSRPNKIHPLFDGFIKASIENK